MAVREYVLSKSLPGKVVKGGRLSGLVKGSSPRKGEAMKNDAVTKLGALRMLKRSVSQVNEAVANVEQFAEEHSLSHIIRNGGKVSLSEFANLIAEDLKMDEDAVSRVLDYALMTVRDLKLAIYEDEDDDE